MNFPYFGINGSDEQKASYRRMLSEYAKAIRLCLESLVQTMDAYWNHPPGEPTHSGTVAFFLMREVAEHIDSISLLVGEGCAESCILHLRSAFEARLGIKYLLESDSENRALAYMVADIHERLALYEKLDADSEEGKKLHEKLKAEPIAAGLLPEFTKLELQARMDKLKGVLGRDPYAAIEKEWQRTNGQYKKWHSLWSGPSSIKRLAYHLKEGLLYEVVYSDWSQATHATGVLRKVRIDRSDSSGRTHSMLPLRHPELLPDVLRYADIWAIDVQLLFANAYLDAEKQEELRQNYLTKVQPGIEPWLKLKVEAPW